jgi:hypothetical protein
MSLIDPPHLNLYAENQRWSFTGRVMKKLKWIATGILFVICSGSISAFGGLYPLQGEDGLGVSAVTVTYGVDSENGNITMDITQDYWGSSENFLWLIPIRSDSKPQVELDFDPFVTPNAPIVFDFPPNYCANLYSPLYSDGDGGDDPGRGYPQPGQIDVLNSDEIMDWLSVGAYDIPDETLNAVQSYSEQGMAFAAIQMSQDEYGSHGSMSRRIIYHSDKIVLPLGILQSDDHQFDLRVNILADTRYVSQNYEDVVVDMRDLRITHAIASGNSGGITTRAGLVYFSEHSNYQNLRNAALANAEFNGFITELAAPTSRIIGLKRGNGLEAEFHLQTDTQNQNDIDKTLRAYRYLTRFDGMISGDILPDAIFVPDPQAPDVTNIRDARSAEPLAVWGCSTRTIPTKGYNELLSSLPSGRTQISKTSSQMRYTANPEGWQLSEINYHDRRLLVVAPEQVDETTIDAYLSGRPTPPMLFLYSYGDYSTGTSACSSAFNFGEKPPQYFRCIANLLPGVGSSSGTFIGILTSDADFAAHEPMYRAMVDYPFTYQYMLHPELRYTLLLSPIYTSESHPAAIPSMAMFFPPLAIGYPEHWRESMSEAQHLLIMPETFSDAADAPTVRGYPVSDIGEPALWESGIPFKEAKNQVSDWLVDHFGVDKQSFLETYLESCGWNTPLVSFKHAGRTGFVAYIVQYTSDQPFILEISAPDALYTDYQHDIENMRDSAITLFGCG